MKASSSIVRNAIVIYPLDVTVKEVMNMADFCKKCSEEHFGKDYGDLKGLCKPGEKVFDICEGCGKGWFDHLGNKIEEVVLTAEEEAELDKMIDAQLEDLQLWK